ncbi:MAG: DUF616 domain-containing protein [Proteobacteria bacterium]|nr:DUF616 domain-containing protein [Pseudomonadota bacterium]
MKKIVYSALTGGYDEIPSHPYKMKDWDYVLFTDSCKETEKNGWKIQPLQNIIKDTDDDNTKTARWHKTNPHELFPEYDYSVWIDCNISIENDLFETKLEKLIKEKIEIASMTHPIRDCIYTECLACVEAGKESYENIKNIISYLKNEGFPKNNGLFETGVLFRKHNSSKITKCSKLWWSMIENYSKRDQLSFTYALWKLNLNCYKLLGEQHSTRNHEGFNIKVNHKIDNTYKREKAKKTLLDRIMSILISLVPIKALRHKLRNKLKKNLLSKSQVGRDLEKLQKLIQ